MSSVCRKYKTIRRNIARQREITYKTMIGVVVLVRDLMFAFITMHTLLFRKFQCEMFNRMQRLEQHRKQYCNR